MSGENMVMIYKLTGLMEESIFVYINSSRARFIQLTLSTIDKSE